MQQHGGCGGQVGAYPWEQRSPRIPKDLGSLVMSAAGSYLQVRREVDSVKLPPRSRPGTHQTACTHPAGVAD